MIRQLRLDGFLSFAPGSEPIELRPLNVLIGPNGAGKSNVIEALRVLAATPGDLAGAVQKGDGAGEWLWKGDPGTTTAALEAVLDGNGVPRRGDMRYSLRLGTAGRRVDVVDEAIEEVVPGNGAKDDDFLSCCRRDDDIPSNQSMLSQLKDSGRCPNSACLATRLEAIQVVTSRSFGDGLVARDLQPKDLPDDRLLPDGSNLAVVLGRILDTDNVPFNDLLRRAYPPFRRLSTRAVGDTMQFHLHEIGLKSPIPATRLSRGIVRFIALLAALLAPSPPPLLCIENPEAKLHPDAAALMANVLDEASNRMQLIVTTHSAGLVSAFSAQPEAIVVCERLGGATHLSRLERSELGSWAEEYMLGELWQMGELGGNP